MANIKISIITCTLNSGKYLEDCIKDWGFNLDDPEFIDLYYNAYKAVSISTYELLFELPTEIYSGYGMHFETILTSTGYKLGSLDSIGMQKSLKINQKTAEQLVSDIEYISKNFDSQLVRRDKDKFNDLNRLSESIKGQFKNNEELGRLLSVYLHEETNRGIDLENKTIAEVRETKNWTPSLINNYRKALEIQARDADKVWYDALTKAKKQYKPVQKQKIQTQ